jgi:hypothetical protein
MLICGITISVALSALGVEKAEPSSKSPLLLSTVCLLYSNNQVEPAGIAAEEVKKKVIT